MSGGADISAEALGPWLAANVAGFGGLHRIEPIVAGQSNPTYLLEAESGRYVLRAKPPGRLLPSAHMVEREFRVMQALAGTPVPVPRMLALAEEGESPLGRAFFVMEHLEGRVFWDPALPELSPAARGRVYDAMNRVLADLHGLDPAALGLGDFGKPGNYFARQTARWAGQYQASAPRPRAQMERLIAWLEANMVEDDGLSALVHGDYRLDNMMFSEDGSEVLGLLDWELSTLGHPLADLAYQCMQWRLPHEGGMRGLGGLDRAALGLPDEAAYLAAYAARRGIEVPRNWPFYLAFAFFRLAAILEGVVARARAGNAANPARARAYEAAIPVLLELASEVIGEG